MIKKYKDPSKLELENIIIDAIKDFDVAPVVELMFKEYAWVSAKAIKRRLRK